MDKDSSTILFGLISCFVIIFGFVGLSMMSSTSDHGSSDVKSISNVYDANSKASDIFNLKDFTDTSSTVGYECYKTANMDCGLANALLGKLSLFDIIICDDTGYKDKRYVTESKGHKIYVENDLEGYYHVDDANYCITLDYHLSGENDYKHLTSSQPDSVKKVFDKILK
ncbi:MAG: hypothetical protein LBD03_05735 [Methanobrevibacter sp.]|jgi:hypothetical protein|nr:hypothetical protein [Candidatus Methanovirga procula]